MPIHPCVQTLAHSEQQHGLLRLRLPLHDLIVVVQLNVEERRTARVKALPQIGKFRLVLHIQSQQWIHLRRRRHHPMMDTIGAPLMREMMLPLLIPERLDIDLRPEVRDRRSLLRLRPAQCRPELIIAPFEMTILVHEENGLRQSVHRIVHNMIDIADNAHTVAFKTPLSVTTPFPCKRGKECPDKERGSPHVGVVAERHKRKREHHDQMDREIDPRR